MATLHNVTTALQTLSRAKSASQFAAALRTVNAPNSAVSAALMRRARKSPGLACAAAVALNLCANTAPTVECKRHYTWLAAQAAHHMGC